MLELQALKRHNLDKKVYKPKNVQGINSLAPFMSDTSKDVPFSPK